MIHSMTVPPVWPASVARAPDWSALPPDPSAMRRMMYATIRCRTPLAAKPARAVYSNAVLSVALSTTPPVDHAHLLNGWPRIPAF